MKLFTSTDFLGLFALALRIIMTVFAVRAFKNFGKGLKGYEFLGDKHRQRHALYETDEVLQQLINQ